MYYLKKYGVDGVTAKLDYPLLHEIVDVTLEDEDIELIEIALKEIEKICNSEYPMPISKKSICKKCAYYDLCFI